MTNKFLKLFGAVALACPLAMVAQTAESPLQIHAGVNEYTPETSAYTTVYYAYTPSAEAEVVMMNGFDLYSLTVVDADGNESEGKTWYSSYPVSRTAFWAFKGNTYKFTKSAFGDPLKVDVTITAKEYNDGQDINNPIVISEGENLFPCQQEGTGWYAPAIPCYAKFVAPQDGKLIIYGLSHPYDCYLIGDDSKAVIDFNSVDGGGYRAVLQIEEGEVITFEFDNGSPLLLSFTVEDSIPGSGPDEPFKTKVGENVIPAEAGTYWYSFTTPSSVGDNVFVVISSEADYPVQINVNGSSSIQAQASKMALRESFGPGVTRLIQIQKEEDTAEPETFTLKFETPQLYDSFNTAEPVNANEEIATPEFAGIYYYSIQSPETGNWFLDVKGAEGASDEVGYYIYEASNSYSYLNGGKVAHAEVQPNTEYIVKASVPQNVFGTKFLCSFNTISQGQTASNPLIAVAGLNEVPETWVEAYYNYTAETNGWVVIELNNMAVYSVHLDGSWITPAKYGDNKVRFDAVAGQTFNLRFDEIKSPASFTISQMDYAPGEASDNPLTIQAGETPLIDYAGNTWYKFECTETGFLNVTTTLPYSYGNSVGVYINEVTTSNRISMGTSGYWGNYEFVDIKTSVAAGDVAYICVATDDSYPDAVINVFQSAAAPGEVPATAIEIPFENGMTYQFEKPEFYTWYVLDLPDGLFSLTTDDYIYMKLYDSTGRNELATSGYNNGGYTIKKTAVSAGKYYLCLQNAYDDFVATIAVSEPGPGESAKTAILIENQGDPTVYALSSQDYGTQRWFCMDLNAGLLTWDATDSLSGMVYTPDDLTSSYASIGYDWISYGFHDLEIPVAGRYYFCIISCYFGCDITMTGSALSTIEDSVNVPLADDADAEYYNLAGVKVAGNLQPGVYVRVANGKATKVVK